MVTIEEEILSVENTLIGAPIIDYGEVVLVGLGTITPKVIEDNVMAICSMIPYYLKVFVVLQKLVLQGFQQIVKLVNGRSKFRSTLLRINFK